MAYIIFSPCVGKQCSSNFSGDVSALSHVELELSTGRARSVFDLARTRLASIGWKEKGLNRPLALIGLVGFGFGGCSGLFNRWRMLSELQMSPKFAKKKHQNLQNHCWNMQKLTRSASIAKICTKIAKICWDLVGSG